MKSKRRVKRTLLIILCSVLLTVFIALFVVSFFEKQVVEKTAYKYTGRKVTMDWIYINPFTGYIYMSNLKIFESRELPEFRNGDSLAFSAKGLSVKIALFKLLFKKTIELKQIYLDHPWAIAIQDKKEFNFRDLIQRFSSKEKTISAKSRGTSYHFNILRIIIYKGIFRYKQNGTPVDYFIKDASFDSPGIRWYGNTIAVKFSFLNGPGQGSANGNITINLKSMNYQLTAETHKFELNLFEQFLLPMINYGSITANLDAKINARGSFTDNEDVNAKGIIAINDFHFGKNPKEDFVSFDKLKLIIDSLNPKFFVYDFDTIALIHPYLKYERYDSLDNAQRMFGEKGSNVSAVKSDPEQFNLLFNLANYIKDLSKNFLKSPYKINRLEITQGNLIYNDFSISEKFAAGINPLEVTADSIDKHKIFRIKLR
jgi:hypothetical protein